MPTPKLPDPDTITAKGTTLKAALAFVESRWGQAGLDRLTDALDEETRSWVSGLVLPATRYPLERFVRVYEAVDREFGRGEVFLKIATVEYWFKVAGMTWKSYYSRGTLTPEIGSGEGRLELTDFNPVSKAFCYRFGGWVEHVLGLSKLRDVRVTHPECLLDGHPACVWQAGWQSRG